jgi:hypothetical protein
MSSYVTADFKSMCLRLYLSVARGIFQLIVIAGMPKTQYKRTNHWIFRQINITRYRSKARAWKGDGVLLLVQ